MAATKAAWSTIPRVDLRQPKMTMADNPVLQENQT